MTATFQTVRVPERGVIEVQPSVGKELMRSATFWGLVERGIVSAEQLRRGGIRLTGGCYVGRSVVAEDLLLEVHEKVSGSLASLLRYASGRNLGIEHISGPTSDIGPLVALLIEHFVEAVREYAGRGRQFEYTNQSMTGSLIGGRLDVVRTVRLRARGHRHLAAFDKSFASFNAPVNRIVLAALREVEHVSRVVHIGRDLIARVRSMAMLFDDCRDSEVLFGARSEASLRAEKLATAAPDRRTADLLSLAAIILAHKSFDQDSQVRGAAPRSWFLNLETLFEHAVREVMRARINTVGTVTSGRFMPQAIFAQTNRTFRANPDLVIQLRSQPCACIGDVKYKQWANCPGTSDVYQLLVHASAFGTAQAFLVFPADQFEIRTLGHAVTNCRVTMYGVNVRELDEQVALLVDDLGILPLRAYNP